LDERVWRVLHKKDTDNIPLISDVERWTVDYLRLLYQHIEWKLIIDLPALKSWSSAVIEYIFTVPLAWDHDTIERFRSIVNRAGYACSPTHSVLLIKEPEAALYTTTFEISGIFHNQILLFLGNYENRTELSFFSVKGTVSDPIFINLNPPKTSIIWKVGFGIVDMDFQKLCLKQLKKADKMKSLDIDIKHAALCMIKSREFQNARDVFGSPDGGRLFGVPVDGLDTAHINERIHISNGTMTFSHSDLQILFDVQVKRIFDAIDKALADFKRKLPTDRISHLVLHGGIGNSLYIQSQLRRRHGPGNSDRASSPRFNIHVSPDPQLSICVGGAISRIQYWGPKS
jgi:hypothetical protein